MNAPIKGNYSVNLQPNTEKILIKQKVTLEEIQKVKEGVISRAWFHISHCFYQLHKKFSAKDSEFYQKVIDQRNTFEGAVATIAKYAKNISDNHTVIEVDKEGKKELKETIKALRDLQSVAISPYLKRQLEKLENVLTELAGHLRDKMPNTRDVNTQTMHSITKEKGTQSEKPHSTYSGTQTESKFYRVMDTQTIEKQYKDSDAQAAISDTFERTVIPRKEPVLNTIPLDKNIRRPSSLEETPIPLSIEHSEDEKETIKKLLTPEDYSLPSMGKDIEPDDPLLQLKLKDRISHLKEQVGEITKAFKHYKEAEKQYLQLDDERLKLFPKKQEVTAGPKIPPPPPGRIPPPPPPMLSAGFGIRKTENKALEFMSQQLLPALEKKKEAEKFLFEMLFGEKEQVFDKDLLGDFVDKYLRLADDKINELQRLHDAQGGPVRLKKEITISKLSKEAQTLQKLLDKYESSNKKVVDLEKQIARAERELASAKAQLNKKAESHLNGDEQINDDYIKEITASLKEIERKQKNEVEQRRERIKEHKATGEKAILSLHGALFGVEKGKKLDSSRKEHILATTGELIQQAQSRIRQG